MGFPAPKFTDAGKQLQLKAIAGQKLKITKMKIGSGSSKNVDITKLTDLIKTEHVFTAVSQEKREKTTEIIATFNNEEIKTSFEFREIGVFALDPDTNQELLYCYTNCGDVAEKIESTKISFIEKTIRVPINVGDASDIEIVVQPGAYATQVELTEAVGKVLKYRAGGTVGVDMAAGEQKTPYIETWTFDGVDAVAVPIVISNTNYNLLVTFETQSITATNGKRTWKIKMEVKNTGDVATTGTIKFGIFYFVES